MRTFRVQVRPKSEGCPQLAAVVDDHGAFRRQRDDHSEAAEMGRRAAAETSAMIDRHVKNASEMSYAIAQVRRMQGLPPTEILTPQMVRDRLGEALAASQPQTSLPAGLLFGLGTGFQLKADHG